MVVLDRLLHHRPHRVAGVQPVFLHRRGVQLLRGEQRAALLHPAVVADVARLQSLPARIGRGRDHLAQDLAVRVVTRTQQLWQQQQAAEEADVGIDLHPAHADHLLRVRQHPLQRHGLPLHLRRQRAQGAEQVQLVIALAHDPHARPRLFALHHHRRLGADAVRRRHLLRGYGQRHAPADHHRRQLPHHFSHPRISLLFEPRV
ncbi:hypothetical protein [Thermomonas sp. S9]|uniref:hypothetical protein n=1 Tax=Thermomonas sp. S9 TaxID=2885203 RepID=UPI00216AFBC2|nr:hypothetical protein [Thermomonas sp. S9]